MRDPVPPFGAPGSDPLQSFHRGVGSVVRATLALIGALLIPIGIIVGILTPLLPIGFPIIICGTVLLARNATWGRRFVRGTINRHPVLRKMAPNWLLRVIFGGDGRA